MTGKQACQSVGVSECQCSSAGDEMKPQNIVRACNQSKERHNQSGVCNDKKTRGEVLFGTGHLVEAQGPCQSRSDDMHHHGGRECH
eukprot:scaffold116427_cov15-Tisochrysis_lutea.AAC.1